MNVFTINGAYYKQNCLPGLNDLLREAERHPMAYNRLKRDMELVVTAAIRRDLRGWKPQGKCQLNITWCEKSKGTKRDYDNVVAAGRKIINDALVKNKVIQDDNPKYLEYGKNRFMYRSEPFIRVEIEELEKDENITKQTDN